MKTFALRLHPGDDLRLCLKQFAQDYALQAGCVLSAIGSLKQATLRFSNQPEGRIIHDMFEVISLAGTLSIHGVHLHMAIADNQGSVLGGHLMEGCLIYTTAEIVIGELEGVMFERAIDRQTGFLELNIREING
ncbi:MAG: DNA-binding protein [Leptolyngbyaceae cyanobacterium SL_7_1]|nr:DNA-binding protein [Leptolyngbyaceae cyanobacterium SL_7_1]